MGETTEKACAETEFCSFGYSKAAHVDPQRLCGAVNPATGYICTLRQHFGEHRAEGVNSVERWASAESFWMARTDIAESFNVMQDDIAATLTALDLPAHARDMSPHEVMTQVVIPEIKRWKANRGCRV